MPPTLPGMEPVGPRLDHLPPLPPDERLARFVRQLAHDINNYLAAMLSRAELLALDVPAEHPMHDEVRELIASAEALRLYVRKVGVLGTTPLPSDDPGPFDERIASLVAEWRTATLPLPLTLGAGESRCAVGTPRLRELLAPLVENARDASAGQTDRITLRTVPQTSPDGRAGLCVLVIDEGAGVPSTMTRLAFEPLASTKKVRGAGLSLALVQRLARIEGGDVWLTPNTPNGTIATLWLPVAR